jgi:hypothetical protein
MKKITLLIILFVFSLGHSQTLLQGFESAGSINGAPFGSMPVPVIEAGTGSNTSQVLKIVTNTAGEPWQGINLFLSPSTDLTVNKTLTIDVLSDTPITFLVKVQKAPYNNSSTSAAPVTHNGDGTWQTLSFTFNTALDNQQANPTGSYDRFVIHPYWEVGRTQFFTPTEVPKPARTFYVDNISEPAPVIVPPVTGDIYINDNSTVGDVFTSAVGQNIGTATGSTSLPYRSLTDLFSDRIIAPGATVHIDSGTYTGRVTFSDTEDGTAGNVITIKGAGTGLTTLNSTQSGGNLLLTNGADYMTFEDMTIAGGDESNAIALITNSTNCTFNNLNITANNNGIAVTTGCNFTTITKNTINGDNSDATDYGIYFTTGASSNHTVSNNMISNFAHVFRSDITSITNCNIYNNSFYGNQYAFVGYVSGWDIRNNIFHTTSNDPTHTAFWYGEAQSPATLDHNLYYHPNAAQAVTRYNSAVYATLADFVAANPSYEANGVEGNPLFVSTTDLHLSAGSPAIGAGTDVGITDDIDGDPRPLDGTFDIGADEYILTISTDATLSALEVDGTGVSGFSSATTDYTVVASSVSTIPQITTATPTSAAASVVITQATDVFEDATIVVTAEDGITTETYTVRIGLVSPNIIQDFEPPATYSDLTGDNGTAATVVSSPGGVSGNSLELVSTSGGATFQAGFFDQVSDFVVLTPENNTVQVDVFSSQAFNLRLKLEIGGGPIERTVSYTATNTWQTLTFDFGAVTATYSRIVFFLNSNATNDGFEPSQDFTAFIDNIALSSVRTEREAYTYQSNTWTPRPPSRVSTIGDDISVLDGITSVGSSVNARDLQIASGATLNVASTGILTTARNITNNGDLVFQSDSDGAAQLAAFSGTMTGTGEETVERFIPARRAFRMLTSAVNGGSIFDNWQEEGNSPAGLGTHITGSAIVNPADEGNFDPTTGFDFTTTGAPSMFTFDNEVENQTPAVVWNAIPNTNATNLFAGTPYRILIRGDRNISLSTNSPTPNMTTLRAKGSLQTGLVNHTFTHPGNVVFVGNPYQSVVNLNTIDYTGVVDNEFAVWDPNMGDSGTFVIVTTGSGVSDPSSSAANQFLQPGQAFFLRTEASGPHSITFNESSKATGEPQTEVFSTTNIPYLNMRLYETERFNTGGKEQDAAGLRLHDENSIGQFSNAMKLQNASENLSFIANSNLTSIQHALLPTETTNFPIFLNNHQHENYTFRIQMEDLPTSTTAYLKDEYTDELIELNAGINAIPFQVDAAIQESLSTSRFSIQLELETFSDTDFDEVAFEFYPNPTEGLLTVNLGTAQATNTNVRVYDLTGRSLMQTNFTTNESSIQIDISQLDSGIYLVEVEEGNKKFTSKILKR